MYSNFANNETLPILDYVYPYVELVRKERMADGTYNISSTKLAAVPCTDIYTPEAYPDLNKQFFNDFPPASHASTEYFCLPPGNYEVWKDAWVTTEGITPNLHIDLCMNLGKPTKLPDFDTSCCVTDKTEIDEVLP